MKKNFLFVVGMTLVLLFSSCSHYVCPTYDNQSGEPKGSGKKSKTTSGLGMPN